MVGLANKILVFGIQSALISLSQLNQSCKKGKCFNYCNSGYVMEGTDKLCCPYDQAPGSENTVVFEGKFQKTYFATECGGFVIFF